SEIDAVVAFARSCWVVGDTVVLISSSSVGSAAGSTIVGSGAGCGCGIGVGLSWSKSPTVARIWPQTLDSGNGSHDRVHRRRAPAAALCTARLSRRLWPPRAGRAGPREGVDRQAASGRRGA